MAVKTQTKTAKATPRATSIKWFFDVDEILTLDSELNLLQILINE